MHAAYKILCNKTTHKIQGTRHCLEGLTFKYSLFVVKFKQRRRVCLVWCRMPLGYLIPFSTFFTLMKECLFIISQSTELGCKLTLSADLVISYRPGESVGMRCMTDYDLSTHVCLRWVSLDKLWKILHSVSHRIWRNLISYHLIFTVFFHLLSFNSLAEKEYFTRHCKYSWSV